MHRRVTSALLLLLGVTRTQAKSSPDPSNLAAFECAINSLAYEFGAARLPAASAAALHDALNLNTSVCSTPLAELADGTAVAEVTAAALDFRAAAAGTAARLPLRTVPGPDAPIAFYVDAVGGSDSNSGTVDAPFATLTRARDAVRGTSIPDRIAAGGAVVFIRGGNYDLSAAPLVLNSSDSYTTYTASGVGGRAVLSAAKPLSGLSWTPVNGGPVLVADVAALLAGADPRLEAWIAARENGKAASAAPPPPVINSFFVNGARQPRARYPNGNPHDVSGICFSKAQRAGEGCSTANGYSGCINGDGGSHAPFPGAVAKIQGITPNRGASPTLGCTGCTTYGTFAYSIFPAPANHPVYDKPLPGTGWTNNSHFTFWGSLFDRSSAAVLSSSCDAHWTRAATWTQPEFGVMQTFHHQLWGGWAYALGGPANVNPGAHTVTLPIAYGGYQEARGGYLSNGQHFYIENGEGSVRSSALAS